MDMDEKVIIHNKVTNRSSRKGKEATSFGVREFVVMLFGKKATSFGVREFVVMLCAPHNSVFPSPFSGGKHSPKRENVAFYSV